MNNWYCSVFTRDDISQVPEAVDVLEGSDALQDIEITRDKMKKKLLALKPKSAPGPDKISPAVLQSMAEVLSGPLTSIFIKCLEEGVVPADWKLANVTPIFKKGSSQSDLCHLQGDGGSHQGCHCGAPGQELIDPVKSAWVHSREIMFDKPVGIHGGTNKVG